jgi:hypothetical protein
MYDCQFVPSQHSNSIQQSVQRRGISRVWHLTRVTQLKNIFGRGALLSRAEMDRLGIPYGMSGWGNDAKAEELKDYICCSIICPWGMSKEEPETKALISLDPMVLLREGSLFCGTWSSFGDISIKSLLGNCTIEAFDLMFENTTSPFPAPSPGEFLVPNCIPVSEFHPRIYFYDEQVKQQAIQSCGSILLPSGNIVQMVFQFVVDRYRFRGSAQP